MIIHRLVATIIRPNRIFKRFIQIPGRGSFNASEGRRATSNQGSAIPMPKPVKIRNNVIQDAPKAKATAVPKNGAEHGVANKVANMP